MLPDPLDCLACMFKELLYAYMISNVTKKSLKFIQFNNFPITCAISSSVMAGHCFPHHNDKEGIINTMNKDAVLFLPRGIQPLTAPYRRRYGVVSKSCTCWKHGFYSAQSILHYKQTVLHYKQTILHYKHTIFHYKQTVLHYKAACACFRMTSRLMLFKYHFVTGWPIFQ